MVQNTYYNFIKYYPNIYKVGILSSNKHAIFAKENNIHS